MTKEEIIKAYNHLRDCHLVEYDISLQEQELKLKKIQAHNEVLLAKEAVYALKEGDPEINESDEYDLKTCHTA